jgi:hypothetical protein
MCKSGLYDVGSQRIRCGLEIVKNKICVKLTSKNIVSKKIKNSSLFCFVLFRFLFFCGDRWGGDVESSGNRIV